MIKGVTDGFEKNLLLQGVGYRVQRWAHKVFDKLGLLTSFKKRPPATLGKAEVKAANKILCWQTFATVSELVDGARIHDNKHTNPCIQLGSYYIAADYKTQQVSQFCGNVDAAR